MPDLARKNNDGGLGKGRRRKLKNTKRLVGKEKILRFEKRLSHKKCNITISEETDLFLKVDG